MHKEIELVSKRNRVLRIIGNGGSSIRKEFKVMKRFSAETGMLKLLKNEGIRVPDILEVGPDYLLLEDLGDETLLAWLERSENQNLKNYEFMVEEMAEFLKDFYRATQAVFNETMIMNDMNFRNFIIHEDRIYRVDLEQISKGEIEADIGRLLAFATTYDPPKTDWKIQFRNSLLEKILKVMDLDRKLVQRWEIEEYKDIEDRRK
ncbi:MAG: hypothetical protein NUK57_03010 [Gudongella sp.]|nr:hypothetical protein [Gudongella sp.]